MLIPQPALAPTSPARHTHPTALIAETLALYNPEHIAVVGIAWDGYVSVGQIQPIPYPFTRPGIINYVTAAMATLYVSQMAYLHTRFLIEHRCYSHVRVTLDDFFLARDNGSLVISDLSLRCHQPISSHLSSFPIALRTSRIHRLADNIVAKFFFDCDTRSFTGSAIMAMPCGIAGHDC
jgi:hypothetical protein